MKQVNEYRVVMAIAIAALLLSFMCASCTPTNVEYEKMEAVDVNALIESMRVSNGVKSDTNLELEKIIAKQTIKDSTLTSDDIEKIAKRRLKMK